MTDSGFSSAASQRSTSSIPRPGQANSFLTSLTPNLISIPSEDEDGENRKDNPLPKPLMEDSNGKLGIPNRLINCTNNDYISPGLSPFSSQGMSPMSSLASDFKDLDTRYGSSTALRKRLSLSSVSSFDSPHPPGFSFLGSNSMFDQVSASSSVNTPDAAEGAGVQRDMRRRVLVRNCLGQQRGRRMAAPVKDSEVCEASRGLYFKPIREEGCFSGTVTTAGQDDDGKRVMEQSAQERPRDSKTPFVYRLKPVPAGKVRFPRARGLAESHLASKENEFPDVPARRRRNAASEMGPSPLGLSDSLSPVGSAKTFSRAPHMMSSPFITAKSSAFDPVVGSKLQRQILGAIDSNVLQAVGGHPATRQPSNPEVVESILPHPDGETSGGKCRKPSGAKNAFLPERKTKSVDAIMGGRPLPSFAEAASPISKHAFAKIRAASAPLAADNDDDDYVLSHSSLCGLDDEDCDDKDAKESSSDIEHIMSENLVFTTGVRRSSGDAPTVFAGLISGPLLLGSSINSSTTSMGSNDSLAALWCHGKSKDVLKPRELFRSPSAPPTVPLRRAIALKRAGRSTEGTPQAVKRPRPHPAMLFDDLQTTGGGADPQLNRSHSHNELDVMKAVDQGCADPTLVGDFSRSCTLPFVRGRKEDLKYVTVETLVGAMDGAHDVGTVEVVDCRYTYEYEGGHVQGAVNVWTEGQLVERYFHCARPMWATVRQRQALSGEAKPHILVFHCEFSSERAPKLARYLRNYDRTLNAYPKLHYPEIYVLKDGYREFYRLAKERCVPQGYVPMGHEAYAGELRKFRVKSKTWAGEKSKKGLVNKFKHQ